MCSFGVRNSSNSAVVLFKIFIFKKDALLLGYVLCSPCWKRGLSFSHLLADGLVSMPSANIRKSEATMLEMEEARRPGRALRSACSLFICYAPGPGRLWGGRHLTPQYVNLWGLDNYTEPPIKHGTEDKPGSENLTSAMVTRSSVAAQPSPAQPSPAILILAVPSRLVACH